MSKAIILALLTLLLFPATVFAGQAEVPILPDSVSQQFRSDVREGRGYVFSKVGDSNSELRQNIYALSCSRVRWGRWRFLRPTLQRYQKVSRPGRSACNRHDSFARISASARSGSHSALYLQPTPESTSGWFWRDKECSLGESYLRCELRLARPRYTFITTGTNDWAWGLPIEGMQGRMVALVRAVRSLGSAPVLTTITSITYAPGLPDPDGYVARTNEAIIRAARLTGAPLINNWRALHSLPDQGLGDGLHFSYPGSDPMARSAEFSSYGLRHGANVRNLLLLRALHRLDRLVR